MTNARRPITAAEAGRLAFTKHVFRLGLSHARQPEPACAVGLLHLHDALELFLFLAAERVGARVERSTTFIGYWPLLSASLGASLPLEGPMKRLNEARVALKHRGHLPRRFELFDFSQSATEFLETATPLVFGVPWHQVSQALFVRSGRAQAALRGAEEAFASGDLRVCLVECRKAYETLVDEYSAFRGREGLMPFAERLVLMQSEPATRELLHWVDASLMALRRDLETIAAGVDPRRVRQFVTLTPMVAHSANWKWHVVEGTGETNLELADAQWCLDFVLDAALKIEGGGELAWRMERAVQQGDEADER